MTSKENEARKIETSRLTLQLLTEEVLAATLERNLPQLESLLGWKVPPDWLELSDLAQRRLVQYRTDFAYRSWGLWGISHRESNEMVGRIGFHSGPNPEELLALAPNAIEFGYSVFPQFRRQGFAREATIGLMRWAIEQFPLENFIASVSPQNLASTGLVRQLGFEHISEHIDPIDGLELVYALSTHNIPLKKEFFAS